MLLKLTRPPIYDCPKYVDMSSRCEAEAAVEGDSHLAPIVRRFASGTILVDEVDSVMAPMTSELNFPVGKEDLIPLGRIRWIFAMRAIQKGLALLQPGVASKAVQTSPHLVLVDQKWYQQNCVVKYAAELASLLTELLPSAVPNKELVLQFFQSSLNPLPAGLLKLPSTEQQLLCLARQWLFHLFPHNASKVSRVAYGLTEDAKRLVSVPFLAKDVPSERSEFAHPDIVIGLAYLSYFYEGLRLCDVERLLKMLVRDVSMERGPPEARPTSKLFESFLSSSNSNVAATRAVPPIHLLNLERPGVLNDVHRAISRNHNAIEFYLDKIVFPTTLKFASRKLTASGQELGNKILFSLCLGFTGTSDDLLPSAITPQHAIEDTTMMVPHSERPLCNHGD